MRPTTTRRARLIRSLVDRHAMDPAMAAWSIDVWTTTLLGGVGTRVADPIDRGGVETEILRPDPVPVPRRRSFGKEGLLIGAAAATIVGGLGLVALWPSSGCGTRCGPTPTTVGVVLPTTTIPPPTTSTTIRSTTTTASTSTFTPMERQLALGSPLPISSCEPLRPNDGAIAVVGCTPDSDHSHHLVLERFATPFAANQAYGTLRTSAGTGIGVGQCRTGASENSWSRGSDGSVAGRLLCHEYDGGHEAIWTDSQDATVIQRVFVEGGTYQELYAAWQDWS